MFYLRRLAGLTVLLSLVAGACATTAPLTGLWRGANSTLRIGDSEIISSTGDQLSVVRVLRRNGDEFIVRTSEVAQSRFARRSVTGVVTWSCRGPHAPGGDGAFSDASGGVVPVGHARVPGDVNGVEQPTGANSHRDGSYAVNESRRISKRQSRAAFCASSNALNDWCVSCRFAARA